jgi:hypothetical protein
MHSPAGTVRSHLAASAAGEKDVPSSSSSSPPPPPSRASAAPPPGQQHDGAAAGAAPPAGVSPLPIDLLVVIALVGRGRLSVEQTKHPGVVRRVLVGSVRAIGCVIHDGDDERTTLRTT